MSNRMAYAELQSESKKQNDLLDELHHSVMGTRNAALLIGESLDEHGNMLNDLQDNVERAADQGRRQNQSVIQLLKDSENRGFYAVVISLVVIIIFLLLI